MVTVVQSVVSSPDGSPVLGAKVTITLVSSSTLPGFSSDRTITGQTTVRVKGDGSWRADITPNADLLPANTHYLVTEDTGFSRRSYKIIVPATGGPYSVSALLAEAPPSPDPLVPVGGDYETPAGAQAKADAAQTAAVAAAATDATTKASAAQSASLQKSANLSDVADVVAARSSLGLGGAAALNVGTTAGTVAAGNDSRFNALGRVWRSGSRYAPQAINLGTGAPGQNEVRYIPVWVPSAVPITEIAAEVTTAGSVGAVARLVIAVAGADGRPGSIVYCSAALPATATGKISATLAVNLAPGRHFFGLVSQGAPGTAPIFRTVTGVSEMYEQPALPLSYLRCCYSSYGQAGLVAGIGGLSIDAADGARVEVLVG